MYKLIWDATHRFIFGALKTSKLLSVFSTGMRATF